MLRAWERADDRAAPRVPDDKLNAAERTVTCDFSICDATDRPDVFLPKLGPDN